MSDKDIYSEIRRTFSSIRSIRIFARGIDFELLKEIHEKLGVVIEERRADAVKEAAERAEREQKRQELLQLIEGEGFTAEDLLGLDGKGGKKGNRASLTNAKYRFIENGETRTWTGKGRKPKPIADALSAGHRLDEFLVTKIDK